MAGVTADVGASVVTMGVVGVPSGAVKIVIESAKRLALHNHVLIMDVTEIVSL
jgi:hypothetical protein